MFIRKSSPLEKLANAEAHSSYRRTRATMACTFLTTVIIRLLLILWLITRIKTSS